MKTILVTLLISAALLSDSLSTVAVAAPAAMSADQALEQIWAIETQIYQARARGSMQPYAETVSKHMLSFGFDSANPTGYAQSQVAFKQFSGDHEHNRIYLKGFYVTGGNTAVIFTRSHRTMRPDGTAVDEYFDTTHIYAREEGRWRLMTSFNRPSKNSDVSSSRPPISPRD
jgi:hypothetical protein